MTSTTNLGKLGKFFHFNFHAMSTETVQPSFSGYRQTMKRLKEEFDTKFHETEVSASSDKLKEYKFLSILGQGAFGLVVIYHSSSSPYITIFIHSFNRNL